MTTIKQAIAKKQALIAKVQQALAKRQSAAEQERAGNYAEACDLWALTSRYTDNAKQREWCINRSDFCDRMATRPFKGANNAE